MKHQAKILINHHLILGNGDRYAVFVKVYEVKISSKFPEGIKAKFVLVDTLTKSAIVLIDNHEPYGFHEHKLSNKNQIERHALEAKDYLTVYQYFRSEVERIIKNENQ